MKKSLVFNAWAVSALVVCSLAAITVSFAGGYRAYVQKNNAAQEYPDYGYEGGDYDYEAQAKERLRILSEIPPNPDVLINVSYDVMPGTSELTALGRKATAALVRGLSDNADDSVRGLCASVLAELRDPAGGTALSEALGDRSVTVRIESARGLGNLAEPKYGPVLLRRLDDPEEDVGVVNTAIISMGNIGYTKAISPMISLLRSDRGAGFAPAIIEALWEMRNKADTGDLIDVFMFVLEEGRWGADRVIAYLGELKADAAVDALAKYYVGKSDWVKNQVVLAMGKIGNGKARQFLKNVLSTTQNARHMNNAAIAMAKLGDRKVVLDVLVKMMSDRKAYLRINAAFALGEIQATEPEAVAALTKALTDSNELVRSEAAVALGRIKAPGAVPALEELAKSTNPYLQLDAVIALNRIDFPKYRKLIETELLTKDPRKYTRVVQRGIRFLAEQKDAAALPYLQAYLRSNSNTADTLGLLEGYDPEKVKATFDTALVYLIYRAESSNLSALLRVIREWNSNEYAPALLERLYHTPSWSGDRQLIYYALGRMGAKSVVPALAAMTEPSAETDLYRLFALANLGDADALAALLDTLENGLVDDQRNASFLLASLSHDAAIPRLRELMKKSDPFLAVAAAAALAGRGDAEALKYLYDVVRNGVPIVADEAARALLVGQHKDLDVFLDQQVKGEKDVVTKRRMEEIQYQRKPKEFR